MPRRSKPRGRMTGRRERRPFQNAPFATCTSAGKVRFPDRYKAQKALDEAVMWGREERRGYQCPSCRDWHLTSMEGDDTPWTIRPSVTS